MPNVLANLEQARDRQSRQPESPLTPSRQTLAPTVHFYAGDWEELPSVSSVVRNDVSELTTGMSFSFSEEDFLDGCSSQDGSIMAQEVSSRRSRRLSRSRAWERASETDQGEGGYDVILMTDIPYPVSSLKKLYAVIKKCLRPPYGVVYLATKKNYSAARHLRSLVDEEGIFGVHLIKELTDRYLEVLSEVIEQSCRATQRTKMAAKVIAIVLFSSLALLLALSEIVSILSTVIIKFGYLRRIRAW
ncbi:Processing isoform 1 [Hibiscus syriacus]|uniref:Processing isoform 1 n=1 Tax=Hibiscus syriacus TaxID=106335 RepID=A0A6A3CQC7_HIBSY|nr:Processing isoform 1 [Hibiscus syriacus]